MHKFNFSFRSGGAWERGYIEMTFKSLLCQVHPPSWKAKHIVFNGMYQLIELAVPAIAPISSIPFQYGYVECSLYDLIKSKPNACSISQSKSRIVSLHNFVHVCFPTSQQVCGTVTAMILNTSPLYWCVCWLYSLLQSKLSAVSKQIHCTTSLKKS